MVQMLDSWSVKEREHSIAKMMLMDVDKSPKAIEGCSQGQIQRLVKISIYPYQSPKGQQRGHSLMQYFLFCSANEPCDLL